MRLRYILLLIAMLSIGVRAMADEPKKEETPPPFNITDSIVAQSNGDITFDMSGDIKSRLDFFTPTEVKRSNNKRHGPKVTTRSNKGYRIQVFCDASDQRTLKARAQARASAILSRFPAYRGQVYTFSHAPKWYCQIGNFTTREEARKVLNQMSGAFPQFSGEFRIVETHIVLR